MPILTTNPNQAKAGEAELALRNIVKVYFRMKIFTAGHNDEIDSLRRHNNPECVCNFQNAGSKI